MVSRPCRRRLLQKTAVVAAGLLAGCSNLPGTDRKTTEQSVEDEQTTPGLENGVSIERRVNVKSLQDERNLETIESIIRDVDNETLLYFPPGQYVIDGPVALENVSNIALVGENATITPKQPLSETSEYFLSVIGSEIHIEGLTADFSKEGYGGRIQILSTGPFLCRDIDVIGNNAGTGLFVFSVRDSTATGVVQRINATDGGDWSDGLFVPKEHAGELRIEECQLAGFKGNGIYASAPGLEEGQGGVVTVRGGEYRNNNIASIRLGTAGSSVRESKVVVDSEIPPTASGEVNSRGVWLHGERDILVEECDITLSPPAQGDGAIVVGRDTEAATVRNTEIVVDADIAGINVAPNESGSEPAIPQLRCEDVSISGHASNGYAISVVGRSHCIFDGMRIIQTGTDRGGFLFRRSEDNTIRNSRIEVTGEPIVLREGAEVDVTQD